jgi:hypothetical protein
MQSDLPTQNLVKMNRRMNYFNQLLNVHSINDVTQTEMHTAEPLVPEPNSFEIYIAAENLKRL